MTDETAHLDRCSHFGDCGGCLSQDVPYEIQLANKASELAALFEPFWTQPITVVPSPVIWHYRNKIELNFGRMHYPEPPPRDFVKETVLGFKKRGKWYWTLDNDECRIASPELPELLVSLRDWHKAAKLRAFDSRRRDGLLRHLLVREGKRTGERMIALLTSPGDVETDAFVDAVSRAYPATSILWGVNKSPGDQAKADEIITLFGEPYITEELHVQRPLTFRLSPFSFFQTNTLATEVLYGRIRDWCQSVAPKVLYDLYGGMGGIAFSCADLVETVSSVESWREASVDGEYNAALNAIDNVTFTTAKVEVYLKQLETELGEMPSDCAVILDPPRAGLHPKALRRLIGLRPPKILYISCKPTVLAQDLESFVEVYKLDDLSAVDLFPHTPHIEVLASLSLR
jgi:23S rRNA (uracil1939-C5)-methyltransferase